MNCLHASPGCLKIYTLNRKSLAPKALLSKFLMHRSLPSSSIRSLLGVFGLIAFALSFFWTSAHAVVVVPVTGASATQSAKRPVDPASSGHPYAVTPEVEVQYVPASRVWYDVNGSLLVCPAQHEAGTSNTKRCQMKGHDNKNAGWTLLAQLRKPGFELRGVQLNETRNGLTLVLYWHRAP